MPKILGILCDPCRKGKKQGTGGFFKQLLKGTIGIVTKPLSGALDYVAYSSEGISGIAIIGADVPRRNKMRYPRPFYGHLDKIKDYKEGDAITNSILRSDLGEGSRYDKYLTSFEFYETDLAFTKFLNEYLEADKRKQLFGKNSIEQKNPCKDGCRKSDEPLESKKRLMNVAITLEKILCYYKGEESKSVLWIAHLDFIESVT
jgi:hypothetical protein